MATESPHTGDRPRRRPHARGSQPRGPAQRHRDRRPDGERTPPPRNPRDHRRSNAEDRSRSPEIDEDVTGRELDKEAASQLGSLNDSNRTWVAKHLVMAGRLVDIDPQLALQHALAASRRGGRLGLVREAVGLTAYAAGDYAEALRELRTYRRITGDQTHLPVQADCERGLGRPEKALELAESPEAQQLTGAARAELAMVLAGAHTDLGAPEAAVAALEIPELNIDRAFGFSPRLFAAYAEALETQGREEEASRWRARIPVAEKALGVGTFGEPEILDFDDEPAALPKVDEVLDRPRDRTENRPEGGRSGDRG